MLTRNQGSVWAILGWQYKSAIFYVAAGLVAWGLHSHHSAAWHLPSLPLAVIGGALGIFVSFRTNTSYARWWEGRQLWGRMVNSSRQLALQLSAVAGPDPRIPISLTEPGSIFTRPLDVDVTGTRVA